MTQKALIANARRCLAVTTLCWRWIEERGLVEENGDVNPVARVLATYANALRLNLVALGLDRRGKAVSTLDEIIREHSRG